MTEDGTMHPEEVRILVAGSRDTLWWLQVKSMRQSDDPEDWVPDAVVPLIERGVRSERLSYDEALKIRNWARGVPGWDEQPGLTFLAQPHQTPIDWHDD